MREDVANELKKMKGDKELLNKSEIARRLGCDRRTVTKYLNDSSPRREPKSRPSILDDYKDLIQDKVDRFGASSTGIYRFMRKIGYEGCYETVNNYVNLHKEKAIKKATIRFETSPGLQAQVDWKEKVTMINRAGEPFEVNLFLMVLGFSRMKYIKLTTNRNQKTLFHCLTEGFKYFGGIPKEILFDNMATVVNRTHSTFRSLSINQTFDYFSKDAGFEIVTCRPYRPQTKGKVETLAKLMDRLKVYNEEFDTFDELEFIVDEFRDELNEEVSQGSGVTPKERFKKEKEYLNPLPSMDILISYFHHERTYKVSTESMINYKGRKYSVPIKYIGLKVTLQEKDNEILIYYTKDLIACHRITDKILHYKYDHVKDILKSDAMKRLDDDQIDDFIENTLSQMDLFLEMEELE